MSKPNDILIRIGADVGAFETGLQEIQRGLKGLEGGLGFASKQNSQLNGAIGRVTTTIGKMRQIVGAVGGPFAVVGGLVALAETLGLVADSQKAAEDAAEAHRDRILRLSETAAEAAGRISRLNQVQQAGALLEVRLDAQRARYDRPNILKQLEEIQQQRIDQYTHANNVAISGPGGNPFPVFLEPNEFEIRFKEIIGEFLSQSENHSDEDFSQSIINLLSQLKLDSGEVEGDFIDSINSSIELIKEARRISQTIDFPDDLMENLERINKSYEGLNNSLNENRCKNNGVVGPANNEDNSTSISVFGELDEQPEADFKVVNVATTNAETIESVSLALTEKLTAPLLELETITAQRLDILESVSGQGIVPSPSAEGGGVVGSLISNTPGNAGDGEGVSDNEDRVKKATDDATNATNTYAQALKDLNLTMIQDGKVSLDALKQSAKQAAMTIIDTYGINRAAR